MKSIQEHLANFSKRFQHPRCCSYLCAQMHSLNIFSKAQINQVQDVSQKLHCTHRPYSLKRWMPCSNIIEAGPDSLGVKRVGVISNPFILEHVHKRKTTRHTEAQHLFLQMSMPKIDFSYYAQYILSFPSAV